MFCHKLFLLGSFTNSKVESKDNFAPAALVPGSIWSGHESVAGEMQAMTAPVKVNSQK